MEVAAEDKAKGERQAAKAGATKTQTKKTTKKTTRIKMVWRVFDERLKEIETFPYREKAAAEAKAASLTKQSGKEHFVNSVKIPTDD